MEIKMNSLQLVTNPNNIIDVETVDKPMIVNSFDSSLDPFTEIQKLPLSTEYGGVSKAHSIRMMLKGKDTELGIVKENYLCISNKEISEVGSEIRNASRMQWGLWEDRVEEVFTPIMQAAAKEQGVKI